MHGNGNGNGKGTDRGFRVIDHRVAMMSDEEVGALAEEEQAHAPSYVEELERDLAAHKKKVKEIEGNAQQQLQDAIGEVKKRLEREVQQQVRALRAQMANPMLEVFDVLERSLQMARSAPQGAEGMLDGMQRVHQLMMGKLGELGFERIETAGQSFDPARHEAIGLTPTEDAEEDQKVAAEVSPGFILDGQVMRAPKVMVYRLQ
ncbi:MAG: nucleotide exchange factor GrpE [Deltaproteobacteria bacterium]|nr:nucleotide exchange factor GrpE [Deltaproteobacteria bacterium]